MKLRVSILARAAANWLFRGRALTSANISPHSIVRRSSDRLPYLDREIQLLYKSKGPREGDDRDFAQTCPLLAADARRWLLHALELTAPHHTWIAVLRDSDAGPGTPTRASSSRKTPEG